MYNAYEIDAVPLSRVYGTASKKAVKFIRTLPLAESELEKKFSLNFYAAATERVWIKSAVLTVLDGDHSIATQGRHF